MKTTFLVSIKAVPRGGIPTAFALWLTWLILSSLACAQSGEILTPAQATARVGFSTATPTARQETPVATESPSPAGSIVEQGTTNQFPAGQEVFLVGKGYLINLVDTAGGIRIVGSQERGAKAIVLEVTELNGQTWVRIKASTGEGWVKADNLSKTFP